LKSKKQSRLEEIEQEIKTRRSQMYFGLASWILDQFLRNKTEQTATTLSIYDDAGTTVDHKATVADDGTTASKAKIVTGP